MRRHLFFVVVQEAKRRHSEHASVQVRTCVAHCRRIVEMRARRSLASFLLALGRSFGENSCQLFSPALTRGPEWFVTWHEVAIAARGKEQKDGKNRPFVLLVGVTRFELATSWSRTTRSTKLSHTPKAQGIITHQNRFVKRKRRER